MLNFRNDPTAFSAFIKEHQDRVYNLVLNKVQNVQDAEEITQDVFIAVFANPSAFRGNASINTWLYRIALNKCIDHLRTKNAGKRRGFTRWFGQRGNDKSNEPVEFVHPGVVSESKERLAILFKAMKQLSSNQHTAWVLSEIENLSYKEISEIMQVSVSSVESLLFRARQNMKKILAKIYPGD